MRKCLTPKQRKELFACYRQCGVVGVRKLAVEWGFSPKYFRVLPGRHGVQVNPRPDRVQPKPSKWEDPRWARAIAIGPVVA